MEKFTLMVLWIGLFTTTPTVLVSGYHGFYDAQGIPVKFYSIDSELLEKVLIYGPATVQGLIAGLTAGFIGWLLGTATAIPSTNSDEVLEKSKKNGIDCAKLYAGIGLGIGITKGALETVIGYALGYYFII